MNTARWQTALLLTGLLTGAILAAYGAAGRQPDLVLDEDAAALVGERRIAQSEYEAVVTVLSREQSEVARPLLEKQVLEKLIDEELLVQYALRLGLGERDRQVRSALVAAVMSTRRAEAELRSIDDASLRQFHADHLERFSPAPTLRLRAVQASGAGAEALLTEIDRQLQAGAGWNAVTDHPAIRALPVPDSLLPVDKLANYIGSRLADAARNLPAAGASTVVRLHKQVALLQLLERRDRPPPPFEAVREAVRAELQRSLAENSLQALLARLRSETRIVTRQTSNAH